MFWWLAFVFVFLLTQDYLFVEWSNKMGIMGFPKWLFWFMGVHALLAGVFYLFLKQFWK